MRAPVRGVLAFKASKLPEDISWRLPIGGRPAPSAPQRAASMSPLPQASHVYHRKQPESIPMEISDDAAVLDSFVKAMRHVDTQIEHRECFSKRRPRGDGNLDTCNLNKTTRSLDNMEQVMEALYILDLMERWDMLAYSDTYVCLLQGCINVNSLSVGRRVHDHIMRGRSGPDIFLENCLLNMYVKCGCVVDACKLFNSMHERNLISWNMMIAGYANFGYREDAFNLYQRMLSKGFKPDEFTFLSILKVCASLGALYLGKQIHAHIIMNGCELDVSLASSLINMYAESGSKENALQVFMQMPKRNVVSWNVMISGYVKHGHSAEAFKLFQQMQDEAVEPTEVTFLSLLKACATLRDLDKGKQIHGQITTCGFESNKFVGNTLVDMYFRCGSKERARKVFDEMPTRSLVSWNTLISGYAQDGHVEEAFPFFWQMEREGMEPDKVTFLSVLKACTCTANLAHLKKIHGQIIRRGFESDISVGSAVIDAYVKSGLVEDARQVFDRMPNRNVVSWTSIITGYTQHELGEDAFELFKQMKQEGLMPNQLTFASILQACATLGALEQGREIHASIFKSGFELDVTWGISLVNMYARCGTIEEACKVFDKMPEKDVVAWTAMIAGFAQHGHGEAALKLVTQMQQEGIQLDGITFINILSACSHAGLVDEACFYFDSMVRDHAILPTMEHYVCMVDILGRAGHLREAEDLIKRMPFEACAVVWKALLGACRVHGFMTMAKCVAKHIVELELGSATTFLQPLNVQSASDMRKNC